MDLSTLDLEVGEKYFIRTKYPHFYVGALDKISPTTVVLKDAAFVEEMRCLSTALRDGRINRAQALPHGVLIPTDSITDVFPWKWPLIFEEVKSYFPGSAGLLEGVMQTRQNARTNCT